MELWNEQRGVRGRKLNIALNKAGDADDRGTRRSGGGASQMAGAAVVAVDQKGRTGVVVLVPVLGRRGAVSITMIVLHDRVRVA